MTLKILAPTRYPWLFNGPRFSAHSISRRNFIPFNKISPKIEGITIFNPFPFQKFDLIHAFNRIPIGLTPYIIGFESHLPRAFGLEKSTYFKRLNQSLVGDRCRGIYAISEYAKRQFLRQHQDSVFKDRLAQKLHVRYPNMPIPDTEDTYHQSSFDKIRLVFIGNHFARKGGTAVLRLAKLAQDKKFPLHIDIISSLEIGAMSWVDPLADGYFDKDKDLFRSLQNITMHGKLPNHQVLEILKGAHFSLLPTFSDTFGFSAIESMANYIPMIATAQGALPEFIIDKKNGLLLDLECDEIGEWSGIAYPDKSSKEYSEIFDGTVSRLAQNMLNQLDMVMSDHHAYISMRKAAYKTAKEKFCAQDATQFWDNTYLNAIDKK